MNALRTIALAVALCANSYAQTDADVRKRIEQVAAAANRIEIDGNSSDWAAIPMMIDSPVDGKAGGPQDIVAVAELSNGTFVMGSKNVKVTIGGCGG